MLRPTVVLIWIHLYINVVTLLFIAAASEETAKPRKRAGTTTDTGYYSFYDGNSSISHDSGSSGDCGGDYLGGADCGGGCDGCF